MAPLISTVIATFNRRDLVMDAIRSVLAQTRPVEQIIVVDDGSTDGTGEALASEFGERIEYIWQENRGVSAARNRGLSVARGQYIAFLDSDDRWHPDKSRRQLAWLQERPSYGMVICDVARVDGQGRPIDVLRRRRAIPQDGDVLKWVLLDPALVPASAMLRRQVLESVGGFDVRLATGEDLDFHLRIARDWKIGVIELPLVTAMRNHDGLSTSGGTYSDYVMVFERFAASVADRLPAAQIDSAVANACLRSSRGLILEGRWEEGWQMAVRAFSRAPTPAGKLQALRLAPIAARRFVAGLRHRRG